MHTKAKYLIGQLRALGFQDWQCAVAIMQHGSHLEACIAFLLEDHITSEEDSKAYMVAQALAPPIDVTEELQMLADAQVPARLPYRQKVHLSHHPPACVHLRTASHLSSSSNSHGQGQPINTWDGPRGSHGMTFPPSLDAFERQVARALSLGLDGPATMTAHKHMMEDGMFQMEV